MSRFFPFCVILLFSIAPVAGCFFKSEVASTTTVTPSSEETPLLAVSEPTDEMLQQLGKENNLQTRWFLSEPVYIFAGQPKRFAESVIGKGNEAFLSPLIGQFVKTPLNPLYARRFIQVSSLPATVTIDIPQQNGQLERSQQPIPRNSALFFYDTPIKQDEFLREITGLPPEELAKMKKGEGELTYYDLTPPNYTLQHQSVIAFPTANSVVFIDGQPADIQRVFDKSAAQPKNAAIARLQRLDLHSADLQLIATLEGVKVDPRVVTVLLTQMGLPKNLIETVLPNLRALTASFNQAVETGKTMLTIRAECLDADGAKKIQETVQGLILVGQTTLASMDENAKKTLPIPPDFAASMLNAMSVNVSNTTVNITLAKFDNFDTIAANGLHRQQTSIQEMQFQLARNEQITAIGQLLMMYRQQNGAFPTDISSKDGVPLLSWRISLLPLMGLEELYKQFKQDEPWDSATNKPLLESMPSLFMPLALDPSKSQVKAPKTMIRFFDSEGTPFSKPAMKLEEITTPQTTLMLTTVAPNYAIEWTKPGNLAFDTQKIDEIVGNKFFGLTFDGKLIPNLPIYPMSDEKAAGQRKTLEAFVKGLPLPPNTPSPMSAPLP